jgi:hypothetical protein
VSSDSPYGHAGEPEYLVQGVGEPPPPRGRGRLYLLAGVGLVAAGAVAVGAWGVSQLTGGGPGAASVLPADTLAYLSIDLDPSAGQKIEAIKTIKKFPALDEELDLSSRDDIREWVVETLVDDGSCEGLDYNDDVKPWIGEKAGVAAVPNEEHIADPVFAIQVSDEQKAEDGVAAVFAACDDSEDFGLAFHDGYMIVAETDELAAAVVSDAKKGSLADSSAYQTATERVGDLGIITFYASPELPKAFSEGAEELFGTGATITDTALEDPYASFEGAAGTVRFDDGGVEVAVAAAGLSGLEGSAEPTSVTDLPETTVAALGFSVPEGWTRELEARLREALGAEIYEEGLSQLERESGLTLPEDLETLLGNGLVFALDGTTDFEALAESEDPSGLKAGFRVDANEDDVRRIVTALERLAGTPEGEHLLEVKGADGRAAVGFEAAYLDALLAGGDLGSSDSFRKAVADAEKANAVLYVDFDAADNWLVGLIEDLSGGDQDAVANAEPLDAVGVSSWVDGDTGHFVLRLSTD